MTTDTENTKGQPAIGEAALFAMCPRCGARSLFAGWIKFADKCRACGLDYGTFNVGDGPAAFLTLIIGAVIMVGALWLQLSFEPPWWVHVILWVPLIIAGVIAGLRLAKAWLLIMEYRRSAAEYQHKGDKEQ